MWRIVLALLLGLATGCVRSALQQNPRCIDPTLESQAWRVIDGEVQSVNDDGSLTLVNVAESFRRDLPPRTVQIASVALDLPAARSYLRGFVGKRVSVWVNPRNVDDERVTGVLYHRSKDINHILLLRGLGRYVQPPAYAISSHTDCMHRLAEEEAQTHRRGLWRR